MTRGRIRSLTLSALVGTLALSLLMVPQADAASPTLPQGRLDMAIREAWPDVPGGVIAGVWLRDGSSWVDAFGDANIEDGKPMRAGLQMPIGSTTKTMTGTLVLQEVQKGTIRLTDRLSRWYPQIPKADEITVAMLLNMTSGIADYINAQIDTFALEMHADPHHVYDIDTLIAQGAALPRVFDPPGSAFAYSNTNTSLLGRILEKVTGRSYEALLQRRLFDPFGMDRTFLDQRGGLEPPYSQTYSTLFSELPGSTQPLGRTTEWGISWGWAAGGLASTIADLHAWGQALGTGAGVLSPATQRLRTKDCSPPMSQTETTTTSYCLGVVAVRDKKTKEVITLWHNGQVFGAVSYVGYYPKTGAVVAVQSNTDISNMKNQNASMAVKEAIEKAIPRALGLPQ